MGTTFEAALALTTVLHCPRCSSRCFYSSACGASFGCASLQQWMAKERNEEQHRKTDHDVQEEADRASRSPASVREHLLDYYMHAVRVSGSLRHSCGRSAARVLMELSLCHSYLLTFGKPVRTGRQEARSIMLASADHPVHAHLPVRLYL